MNTFLYITLTHRIQSTSCDPGKGWLQCTSDIFKRLENCVIVSYVLLILSSALCDTSNFAINYTKYVTNNKLKAFKIFSLNHCESDHGNKSFLRKRSKELCIPFNYGMLKFVTWCQKGETVICY